MMNGLEETPFIEIGGAGGIVGRRGPQTIFTGVIFQHLGGERGAAKGAQGRREWMKTGEAGRTDGKGTGVALQGASHRKARADSASRGIDDVRDLPDDFH